MMPTISYRGGMKRLVTAHRPVKARGNFVFGEEEYFAEYADPYKWSNLTQLRYLGESTGLFVGLSMEDPNIRRLIDVTHRQFPGRRHYVVLPRKQFTSNVLRPSQKILDNLFEQVETTSFENLGVNVIWVGDVKEVPVVIRSIVSSVESS
jgi:hypothetical protein